MALVKEFFIKKRLVMDCNNNDFSKYIRIYNGKTNIFESLYCYDTEVSKDTVVVDKLFLDFDNKGDDLSFFENAKKISTYFMDNNIKYYIRFSGRGFHIFPYVLSEKIKNYSIAMKNCVKKIHELNNTTSDDAVVGDLRRLRRVLHTINPKSGLYCIPLSYEDLQEKSYDEIKQYAQQDRGYKDIVYGDDLISLSEYDSYEYIDDNYQYNSDVNIDVSDDFPPCIQSFLNEPQLGYKERTDLIIYLRDMAYTEDEIYDILEKHLSAEKFHHCMSDERQVENIMNKDMLLMRSCRTLKFYGLCPSFKCKGNNLYI